MVLGLLLTLAVYSPVSAGKGGNGGNNGAGCNQNKETPEHRYDADCDGSASENGGSNGGGGNDKGGGKPCAGCVGKADNKHPPGQEPDENDRNKGYECDDNKGVGAERGTGNPAHTGCRDKTPSPTPSTPAPTPSTPGPTPTTPGPTPSNPGPTPSTPGPTPTDAPTVLPTIIDGDIDGDGQSDDDVLGERPPSGGGLPFTGAALGAFVLLGIGLVGAGWTAIRRAR